MENKSENKQCCEVVSSQQCKPSKTEVGTMGIAVTGQSMCLLGGLGALVLCILKTEETL